MRLGCEPSNNRWRGPWGASGLAPRALRNCAPSAPRAGASVRPLNFTVRCRVSMPASDHRRVFWRAAVVFGTAMAVPRLFQGQYALAAIFAVVGGAIAGALFAGMNSLAERRLARQGITATNTDPIQVRELDIECPTDVAFDLSIRALQGIPKLRVVRADSTSHEID